MNIKAWPGDIACIDIIFLSMAQSWPANYKPALNDIIMKEQECVHSILAGLRQSMEASGDQQS
jgi:hypothetical protein